MLSVYRNLSLENKQLIQRLIWCTILATGFSCLIGETFSPTAAVTANLFLSTDRGYRGSVRFGTRRVLVHIIQGFLVMAVIFPCKYFGVPIPDPILIIISFIFAIVIGVPLNMKYSYSPVLSTLGTATIIIACGTVRSFTRFPFRVLECVAGYAIGYVVCYLLVPSEDRYQRIKRSLIKCSELLLHGCTSSAYRKAKKSLDTDIQYLTEDSEQGLKRYHHEDKELLLAGAFKKILEAVESYQDHLAHYQPMSNPEYIKKLHTEFHLTWDQYILLLNSFLDKNYLDPPETFLPSPSLKPENDGEVLLASDIIDFRERLRTLINIQNGEYPEGF